MPRNFSNLRASILYTIGLFMCLQAIQAKEPAPTPMGRAVPVASTVSSIDSISPLMVVNHPEGGNPVTLVGVVRSAGPEIALEGVRVKISGVREEVFTDQEGNFSIKTDQECGILIFSRHGYEPIKAEWTGGSTGVIAKTFRMEPDLSSVEPLTAGDRIPDHLWDLPLDVFNHPADRSVVTLREYREADILVLCFWARWCSPCVRSIDRWQAVQHELGESVRVIAVQMDKAERGIHIVQDRGWKLPVATGKETRILNRYFFDRHQVGGIVLIRKGEVLAIPKDKGYDIDRLKLLLRGETVHFEPLQLYTYGNRDLEGGGE